MRRDDFTDQLIACLHTKRYGRRVISLWAPDAIAAPERHVYCGIQANMSLDEQYESLMKSNVAFDTIESMLNISFHKSYLKALVDCNIEDEKEQVWLFAHKWLAKYYNFLMEPDVLYSPFYRQDHDRFIELLTKMCAVLPEKRITFLDAVQLWSPGVLTTGQGDNDDVALPDDVSSDDASLPRHDGVSLPRHDDVSPDGGVSVKDGPSTSLLSSSDSSVRRRLALKGLRGPQGRNKTRRSSRN